RAEFLERALVLAAHFDRREHIHSVIRRFQALLQSTNDDARLNALGLSLCQCFRGLRKLGMREEIDQLLNQLSHQILKAQHVQELDVTTTHGPDALQMLLHIAGAWLYFGRDRLAEPILQRAQIALFGNEVKNMNPRTLLACAYAAAVGEGPIEVAQKRLEE